MTHAIPPQPPDGPTPTLGATLGTGDLFSQVPVRWSLLRVQAQTPNGIVQQNVLRFETATGVFAVVLYNDDMLKLGDGIVTHVTGLHVARNNGGR